MGRGFEPPYRFYAAEISYFSGKARPALRIKRVPFDEILPTPEVYREVIAPRTGLGFIPVIVTPEDETLQDTSDILDFLEERFPDPPLYPATPKQRIACFLWEVYADEFMVILGLHYRWSFPESEAQARADFAASSGDPETAGVFAGRIKAATPMFGITEETQPVIEAHTEELLARLEDHFAEHRYLLGGHPSLADCALMGPMYPHLYLDAVPGRLLRETAPRVCHWIQRMNHPDPQAFGDWLPDDALASTLRPLHQLMGRDAFPLLLDTVRDFEAWADEHARESGEPPRATGIHETALRGVRVQRYTNAYTLWMLQRVWDAAAALSDAERRSVDEALVGSGCEALLSYAPRHRLGKRNYKLVFESAGGRR
jgi:glutathione S-transferase